MDREAYWVTGTLLGYVLLLAAGLFGPTLVHCGRIFCQ